MDKPVKIYAEVLEPSALSQFYDAMRHPAIVRGALMPDAHTGYSLPIGGVVAARNAIFPAFVGYDIGCGMCALPTSFKADDIREHSNAIFEEIYRRVPVGANFNDEPVKSHLNPAKLTPRSQEIFPKRRGFCALGTLGGGNHFIEVGADETEQVWVIIHSGSRGIGHGIASEYMKLASGSDKAKEGCYPLAVDSELGQDYINDMNWALEFALENRKEMMKRIVASMAKYCRGKADWDRLINRNHNHATEREIDGEKLWIHRKGATHAEAGMDGVIPGNMRDGSFVVRGLGNPDSMFSSSHGAGRVMSRAQAKENVSMEDFEAAMEGITARVTAKTRDESPAVYKSIFDVMELQKDLVEVVAHVRPIINVKG